MQISTYLLKEIPLRWKLHRTSNGLHVSLTCMFERGVKNILLEKPIANTVEEAQEIIAMRNEVCDAAHWPSSSFFVKVSFLRDFIESVLGICWCRLLMRSRNRMLTCDVEWHTKKVAARSHQCDSYIDDLNYHWHEG